MITGITKDTHGIADLTYVPLVFAAPALVGFEQEGTASNICRAFSITALTYSLLTDAKWGAVKLIPYKTHAALDLSMGIAALAAPALLKKSSNKAVKRKATNTLLLMGLTGIVVGTLSLIGAKRS